MRKSRRKGKYPTSKALSLKQAAVAASESAKSWTSSEVEWEYPPDIRKFNVKVVEMWKKI